MDVASTVISKKKSRKVMDWAAKMFELATGEKVKNKSAVHGYRAGKTRRERNNGVLERHMRNKENEAAFHRSGDPKDRPNHYNGKKQFTRRKTIAKNRSAMVDRVGKHEIEPKDGKKK